MLSILGSTQHACDRISRREVLRIGGLGTLGLSLPTWLEARAAPAAGAKAAKACILIYMWGGPAHQDTWDLKPEGPSAVRGEFKPIDTTARGIQISEHFPRIARHGS